MRLARCFAACLKALLDLALETPFGEERITFATRHTETPDAHP